MGAKAFRHDFTMRELGFLLFNKKNCPKCKNKLTKRKQYELVDGSKLSTTSTPLYIKGRKDVKHYYYFFNCPNCGTQYTLKELAKKNNKGVKNEKNII